MHYQIDISSSKSYLDESNQEFESILDINIMTQLEYSISKFWFDLNTRFQNSDLNRVLTSRELDSISMTWLDAISLQIDLKTSTFSILFTRSNLNIFYLFWKHLTQLIQSYNCASQSMLSNQCAWVDSSEKRWWHARNRSISTLNFLNLIYWVKSQYFSIILKALNSTNSELQLCFSKYVR